MNKLKYIEKEFRKRITDIEEMINTFNKQKDLADFFEGTKSNAEFEAMFLKRIVNEITEKEKYTIEYFTISSCKKD